MIALTAFAAVAHAQPRPDPSNPDIVVAYKIEVEQGTSAFRAGLYNDARVSFERAYSLYPEPVLLFNIASCYRRAGDAPSAVAAYRRFLDAAPADDHRVTLATQTISSLERELADAAAAAAAAAQDDDVEVEISDGSDETDDDGTPILRLSEEEALPAAQVLSPITAPTATSTPSPRRSNLPKYGLGVASAGALVLLGAAIDGYRAHSIAGELDALPRDHQWNHDDDRQYRAGESAALRARVLAISGVALTATGVTLFVIGKRRDAGQPRIEGVVGPSGGQVVVRGRF